MYHKEKIMSVNLGYISLSFHYISALIVKEIIEKYGVKVNLVTAPHEELFIKQKNGEIDFLVSAWLPSSHEIYLEPYLDKVLKLGKLYDPFCVWAVPDYIPKNKVNSLEDLLKKDVIEIMNKNIQGINKGAGITRFSLNMMKEYSLEQNGYQFNTGTLNSFADSARNLYQNKSWFVIPLWKPQYLNKELNLRVLNEPKKLLGGIDLSQIILLKNTAKHLPKELLEELNQLIIGNEKMSLLDYKIEVENKDPIQIAKDYINNRE